MSDRNHYSNEMKAGAMAALLAGQSVTRVAEQYSIPRGTVGRWSSELRRTGETFETKKEKAAIGELLMEYVSENLRTLREQTVIFRDSEWVEQQNAAEMAVLHGVLADKTIRILEALTPAEPRA